MSVCVTVPHASVSISFYYYYYFFNLAVLGLHVSMWTFSGGDVQASLVAERGP